MTLFVLPNVTNVLKSCACFDISFESNYEIMFLSCREAGWYYGTVVYVNKKEEGCYSGVGYKSKGSVNLNLGKYY